MSIADTLAKQGDKMESYKNLSGQSNVLNYEIGADFIIVEFDSKHGERFYKYSYSSAGEGNIEQMKQLANQGSGLNSFIMNNVKKDYESKW